MGFSILEWKIQYFKFSVNKRWRAGMKNRNVTGIVVAIIYCVVLYVFLTDAPPW
jgi:hypothetical protein